MLTPVFTDADIQQAVIDELDWDPEVEVTDVGVEVDDGVVTLTGTVHTFTQNWAAEHAALRVSGVRAVANNIIVRPAGMAFRSDTDLARAIADTLEWNPATPFEQIDIRVSDGHVTLEGEVDWNFQREQTVAATKRIKGVKAITNLIRVRQHPSSEEEIQQLIELALVRHAELDAERIRIEMDQGHVTLSGAVSSRAEKRQAEEAVWRAPGVHEVTNNLEIRIT